MKKDLLTIRDLSRGEIEALLQWSHELKALHHQGRGPMPLTGKTLVMIFDKPSTRTRVSFEAGMAQLGGTTIYLERRQTQLARAEPLSDTARVLSRYVNGVVVRTFAQEMIEELALHAAIVLLVFQLGQARLFMSMSRDGLLPPFLAKVHPKFKAPYIGTILTGIFVGVFAAFANIAEVVDLTNIGTLFALVLVSLGVIVLRYKEPERVRPFRVPFVPWTPMISIVACLYLMFKLPKVTWERFGIWLLVGLVVYFLYGMRHSRLRIQDEAAKKAVAVGRRNTVLRQFGRWT